MLTRRHRERFVSLVLVLTSAALLSACAGDGPDPQAEGTARAPVAGGQGGADAEVEQPSPLASDRSRSSGGDVAAGGADAVYNYGPTVMTDGPSTRMWWCSQYGSARPAGDDILYATAASPDGPFRGVGGGMPDAVLSGQAGAFDAVHTCDPSVIRVGATYYMYYTGAAGDHALGNGIGLATSADGVHWQRRSSAPVVSAAHDVHRGNTYGVGQPAAVYLDGWFYLMFTDTTGRAAGWNGAGQFLLRSRDPAFASGVQSLGPGGFTEAGGTDTVRTNSLVDAFSADLMWVDALDAFAIAHQTKRGTTITFWNRDFTATPHEPVLIPDRWQEGPGLVRQPDGHAPVSQEDPCGRVPLDVIHATVIGTADAPTGLRHFGLDVHGIDACTEPTQASAVLAGFAMPSPVRTMDLVAGGKLVRVDRRSVAEKLASGVLDERERALDELPVAARLPAGTPAVRAPGRGTGFLLDDRLWPVGSPEAAELNDSPIEEISDQEWDAYPKGPALG